MDTYGPHENGFKRWIKEAVKEFFPESAQNERVSEQNGENLLNCKEIVKFLRLA